MMQNPDCRIALVTGAAHRIGRAIALDLSARGWTLAVHYGTSEDAARALVETIESQGGRAEAFKADLAVEKDVTGLIPAIARTLGPLSLLVNCASAFEFDSWDSADRDGWDLHMEVNLRAPFVLTQEFARQVPERIPANVINIVDQRVWSLTPFFTTYTLSKAGLWTLTQTLALALAPKVRVNAIGPGPVLRNARQSEEDFARQCAETPLGRAVDPEEICDAVRFIVGAPSMTGQMIALDAGQHLAWGAASNTVFPQE